MQFVLVSRSELGCYINCRNMHGTIKLKLLSGSKKCQLKQQRQNCSYYSCGQLQRMEKNKKGDHDSWFLSQDLNPRQT